MRFLWLLILMVFMGSCQLKQIKSTLEIWVTSEKGDKLARKENVRFTPGRADGVVIEVLPDSVKQTIDGIGSSFTESAAFVLAHLKKDKRLEVMRKAFGADGADFSLARTHIGACDFCVEGKYSYADKKDDLHLAAFSIAPDKAGFDKQKYPGIVDETYDLLPMIKEAIAIKKKDGSADLRLVSSAWTAPSWMKDIEDWYIPGSPANNWQGTGGSLKEKYISTYADYLVKYLDTYRKEGVEVWGMTPVNEPHGNNGQWESMNFSPETQNDFIKTYLGPKLKSGGHADTRLLIYDQNRDGIREWTDTILSDPQTRPYVYGTAIHWYESTFKVYEGELDAVHEKFPEFGIIHTEGCIDDLGKKAPNGISDPERFQEKDWFDNDAFWWNPNATDWAYSAEWAPNKADHPIYTPVHRYARNIIVSIDHWLQGWIDWNLVLDKNGGPNHAGNFCGAPIMVDTETQQVYYTPIFYVLEQFSKTIRPGDKALKTIQNKKSLAADALHACATINSDNLLSVQALNTTKKPIKFNLQLGAQFAKITIPANSVQTVRVQL